MQPAVSKHTSQQQQPRGSSQAEAFGKGADLLSDRTENSGEMADGEGSGLSAGNLETIVDMVVAKLQGAAREGHASASTRTMEGTATASEGESTRD